MAVKKKKNKIGFKLGFFIMSLMVFFVIMIVLNFRPEMFTCFRKHLLSNIVTIVSAVFLVLGICFFVFFNYISKGSTNPAYTVTEVKNEDFEYVTFLTTYIIPLVCFRIDLVRYVIALGLLLILIGVVFIKMDLYYANPALLLLGYRLYTISVNDHSKYPNGIKVISRSRVVKGSQMQWMEIDDGFWIVKEK